MGFQISNYVVPHFSFSSPIALLLEYWERTLDRISNCSQLKDFEFLHRNRTWGLRKNQPSFVSGLSDFISDLNLHWIWLCDPSSPLKKFISIWRFWSEACVWLIDWLHHSSYLHLLKHRFRVIYGRLKIWIQSDFEWTCSKEICFLCLRSDPVRFQWLNCVQSEFVGTLKEDQRLKKWRCSFDYFDQTLRLKKILVRGLVVPWWEIKVQSRNPHRKVNTLLRTIRLNNFFFLISNYKVE